MISTFPQRDYCYDFQPGSSHPSWIKVGEQVARDLIEQYESTLRNVWSQVRPMEARVSKVIGSRAALLHPKSIGCRYEIDMIHRVAAPL